MTVKTLPLSVEFEFNRKIKDLVSIPSFLFALVDETKPYLECQISDARVPEISGKFEIRLNEIGRNYLLVYFSPGASEELFAIYAKGNVYQEKWSRRLDSARFRFSDNTALEIRFANGVGIAKTDNAIFKHFEESELTNCIVFEQFD